MQLWQPISCVRIARLVARVLFPFVLLLGAMPIAATAPARAADVTSDHRDTFGEIGLLEMPSARMAPDGQLALTAGGLDAGQHIALAFQMLPWLETSFRYSRVPRLGSGHIFYDRSVGLKLRLFREGDYIPDVSFGIRDLTGTGLYGAEYLVASKRLGDFDATLGLGWGRLAGTDSFSNPFGTLWSSFYKRKTVAPGKTGTFNLGSYLHGPDAGLFGGIVWHTPIEGLDLTVEYSSDAYRSESAAGTIKVHTPVNVGLSYAPFQGASLTAGWFYGSTFGAILTFWLDPKHSLAPDKDGPAPLQPAIRTEQAQSQAVALYVRRSALKPGPATPALGETGRPPRQRPQASSRPAPSAARQLSNALQTAADVEIDGRTLLVSTHAGGRGATFCQTYAQLASQLHLSHVAVADLDADGGRVSFCDVPQGGQTARLIPTSADTADMGETWTATERPAARMRASHDASDAAGDRSAAQAIRRDAAAQKLRIDAISMNTSEIFVYYTNTRYEIEDTAIGRLLRVVMADAPARIEVIHLIPVVFGIPTQDVRILRSPVERIFATHGSISDTPEAFAARPAPLDNPVLEAAQPASYPRFSWSVSPGMREALLAPKAALRVQFYVALNGGVELLPGLSLEGQYQANVYDNFSKAVSADSRLAHVRTDLARYLTTGRYGFSDLDLAYRRRLAPDIFAELKAGYLENMYAGVGAQILWRPQGKRWALGADLYQVWKRDYNRLFGLQHYNVLTGHVSVYYRSPWYGLDFNLHVGRYLAGDYGATIEIARRFLTDIDVGVYATFTNVPFAKFGDGSFDKGIFLRIPLEALLPFNSQSDYSLTLSPLVRDGGQRLVNDDSLYYDTRRASFDEILRHRDKIVSP